MQFAATAPHPTAPPPPHTPHTKPPNPASQEVKAWMDRPENALEFVILYFDDQANLQTWVGGRAGRPLGRHPKPANCGDMCGPAAMMLRSTPAAPYGPSIVQPSSLLVAPCFCPTPLCAPPLGSLASLVQGVVGNLLADITSIFPEEWVFTTEDKAAFGPGWPSQQQVRPWRPRQGARRGGEGGECVAQAS